MTEKVNKQYWKSNKKLNITTRIVVIVTADRIGKQRHWLDFVASLQHQRPKYFRLLFLLATLQRWITSIWSKKQTFVITKLTPRYFMCHKSHCHKSHCHTMKVSSLLIGLGSSVIGNRFFASYCSTSVQKNFLCCFHYMEWSKKHTFCYHNVNTSFLCVVSSERTIHTCTCFQLVNQLADCSSSFVNLLVVSW